MTVDGLSLPPPPFAVPAEAKFLKSFKAGDDAISNFEVALIAPNLQLNEQVFLPMPVRLARKLLYLVPDSGNGRLALSQAELAEYVGATREAVSKTLSNWKRSGLIEISRGGVQILDRSALGLLAEPESI